MKGPHGGILEKNTLKGYCDKHVPADWRIEHNVEAATEEAKEFFRRNYKGHRWADSQQSALAVEQAQENPENEHDPNEDPFSALGNNKRKKALLKKIWRLPSGAPIVPQMVYNNVESTLARWALRKRKEFVAEACKYWTLKREARRGAALLKRLQLQLETFSSMEMTRRNFAAMGAAGGPKLQQRIEFAERLEKDLEQVRELCEKAEERETLKLKDVNLLREIVDTVYFPIPPLLWPILEKAQT
jgi:NuA3 HAT complex component NTO1